MRHNGGMLPPLWCLVVWTQRSRVVRSAIEGGAVVDTRKREAQRRRRQQRFHLLADLSLSIFSYLHTEAVVFRMTIVL